MTTKNKVRHLLVLLVLGFTSLHAQSIFNSQTVFNAQSVRYQVEVLATGLLQHLLSDPDDQAAILGDGNEVAGRDHAMSGMTPADQRLHPDHAAVS